MTLETVTCTLYKHACILIEQVLSLSHLHESVTSPLSSLAMLHILSMLNIANGSDGINVSVLIIYIDYGPKQMQELKGGSASKLLSETSC
jgi:hypothetical protein